VFIPIADWFPAFLLTIAVEIPIVIALVRPFEPDLLRLVVLIVFVNLATHLAAWYVFSQLFVVDTVAYTGAAEAWAVAAEALFYWATIHDLSWRRALGVAIVANATSFIVGDLVGALLPSGPK
jgi:hypothetical protein